jgi:tRNA(Ile)-lysidine synthase
MRSAKKQDRPATNLLPQRVLAKLRQLAELRVGARIGVAVSGGADSVALLRLLIEAREEWRARKAAPQIAPLELALVHFHHGLRGKAADGDQRFVQKLAEKYGMPFYPAGGDIKAVAKSAKRNLEDAGRRERYAFFQRLVAEQRVDFVATAHTMDDQAETVLAHLLRGTGLAGLAGVHPVSGSVLRPLLDVRRAELRKYLRSRKQAWREDATNLDSTRMRARIREKLIPFLENQFQAEVVAHLAMLAEHAREDEEFLKAATARKLAANGASSVVQGADERVLRIRREELIGEGTAPGLRGRMVRKMVQSCKVREGELGAQHVASVLRLARDGENGKSLRLPGGVEVRREKDALSFHGLFHGTPTAAQGGKRRGKSAQASAGQSGITYEYEVRLENAAQVEPKGEREARAQGEQEAGVKIAIPSLMRAFRFTKIDWPRKRSETSDAGAMVDCARLSKSALVLRNWRPGDRLQPQGRSSVHKLKRLLNEKGISRWERDGWPVLSSDGIIVWARGFPVAAGYAAGEGTRTAMVIAEEAL